MPTATFQRERREVTAANIRRRLASGGGLPFRSYNKAKLMTIVLCRHGTTDANAGGAILSRNDPSLNRAGREQSERALRRTRRHRVRSCVLQPNAALHRNARNRRAATAYRCDERLREVDFGTWEGRTLEWLEINDSGRACPPQERSGALPAA